MADDEAVRVDAFDHGLDREAMEAVAPDPPLLSPLHWDRVGRRLGRDGSMERRVEDRDVRHVG
jgi:hypothetical protein